MKSTDVLVIGDWAAGLVQPIQSKPVYSKGNKVTHLGCWEIELSLS